MSRYPVGRVLFEREDNGSFFGSGWLPAVEECLECDIVDVAAFVGLAVEEESSTGHGFWGVDVNRDRISLVSRGDAASLSRSAWVKLREASMTERPESW